MTSELRQGSVAAGIMGGMNNPLQVPNPEGSWPMIANCAMTLKTVEWLYPRTRYRLREPLKCEAGDSIMFEVSGPHGAVTIKREGAVVGESLADLE